MSDEYCAYCGKPNPSGGPFSEESTFWHYPQCSDAWDAEHPEEASSGILVSELTPEQLNAMLNDVGLCLRGIGTRVLS